MKAGAILGSNSFSCGTGNVVNCLVGGTGNKALGGQWTDPTWLLGLSVAD